MQPVNDIIFGGGEVRGAYQAPSIRSDDGHIAVDQVTRQGAQRTQFVSGEILAECRAGYVDLAIDGMQLDTKSPIITGAAQIGAEQQGSQVGREFHDHRILSATAGVLYSIHPWEVIRLGIGGEIDISGIIQDHFTAGIIPIII